MRNLNNHKKIILTNCCRQRLGRFRQKKIRKFTKAPLRIPRLQTEGTKGAPNTIFKTFIIL